MPQADAVEDLPGLPPRVALVAGEASGDLLAGLLLEGLNARWPGLSSVGIGGPRMQRQGFHAWWPSDKLAVHGFSWELLRRYREIVGIRGQLKKRLLANRPGLFIGVDAPDFNLDLEAALKEQGLKTVHFVCPSIWAWRPDRVEKIRRSADHVLCIFPFEPALLKQAGIDATYVGHPLASVIPMRPDRAAARRTLGISDSARVVAILPGSRRSEIKHLGLRFFQAAALIQRQRPHTQFVVPVAPGLEDQVKALVRQSGMERQLQLLSGQSHLALAACDATLIASGTATLEAALFKRPMVIAYHMSWLSWQLMRRKRLQPWVGLPNILCAEFVVPELLQEAATPQALAGKTLEWLDVCEHDPAKLEALQARFAELHRVLQRDTATIAADAIQTLLQS
jgi:lipid-A-disaccharide synthase